MKLKILLIALISLLALGVSAVYGQSSGAWFTDSAVTPGSIITSGTLDLSVTGKKLKAANLEPGKDYLSMGTFCSKNTGTMALKYRGLFEPYAPSTNDLLSFITMKVELQTETGWTTLQEIPGSNPVDPPLVHLLKEYFKFPDQAIWVVNQYIVSGSLTPNQEACYRLSIKLAAETPNYDQNKSLDFVLHLDATQATNPGWE